MDVSDVLIIPVKPGRRTGTMTMLNHGDVATRLQALDLDRAKKFCAEKLRLEPVEERPGGLPYSCGNSKGTGEKAVWFKASEGNLLGVGQPTR